MTSRIPSSPSYQEHWPSILSHNRSAQQRSEPSESGFGQTFREQLSSNDETSTPARSVPTSAKRGTNQEPRDQAHTVSKSESDKPHQATTESTSKNGVAAKTATPLVSLDETKASSDTKTNSSGASNISRESRKSSSRTELDSGDPQPDLSELPPNGLQAAPVMANQDVGEQDQSDTDSGKHEVQDSKPVEVPGSSGNTPIQGDLAMAMRISSTNSDTSPSSGQNDTSDVTAVQAATVIQHNQAQVTGAASPQQRHDADNNTRAAGSVSATQPNVLRQAENPAQPEESKSTNPADFEAEFNKFRSEPVRGAYVQITGAENQRVDIRLQERAGTLSVSVRSNDSALTKILQDHSPELNTRLSAEHFRTELWTPNANKTSQERGSNANSGQEQQQTDHQRHQEQGRKGRQNQSPDWIAELENDPAAFQKRIEYTWHQ